jgi:hypothetical protein
MEEKLITNIKVTKNNDDEPFYINITQMGNLFTKAFKMKIPADIRIRLIKGFRIQDFWFQFKGKTKK